jgi:hypothetical protein
MTAQTTVEAMLAAAGLTPPPDEVAELVAAYPALRASIELLYAPEFALAEPLLVPAIG